MKLDIKALTVESPELVSQLGPAFERYNEEQFATVKLPGGSQQVGLLTMQVVYDWTLLTGGVGYCELAQLAG